MADALLLLAWTWSGVFHLVAMKPKVFGCGDLTGEKLERTGDRQVTNDGWTDGWIIHDRRSVYILTDRLRTDRC